MKTHAAVLRQRKLFAPLTLLSLLIAACAVALGVGMAQSTKDEREIEDKIPRHLPIKMKVKNLEKVKDLKNENWLGDVQIEVTNTGSKPIYYLNVILDLPDARDDDGVNIAYRLRYGRVRLIDLSTPLQPSDVPIQPGESYVLRVPMGKVEGWKSFKARRKIADPKKLEVRFQALNFGDGTGFVGTSGDYRPKPKERGSRGLCLDENNKTVAKIPARLPVRRSFATWQLQPVSFLPVNFSPNDMVDSDRSPTLAVDICCPGAPSGCSHLKQSWVTCGCNDEENGEQESVQSASCTDPYGGCHFTEARRETCKDYTGTVDVICDHDVLGPSCSASSTPTPTPTPSPTPSPTPADCPGPPRDDCWCDREAGGVWRCCDPQTRPNPDCRCEPIPVGQSLWVCTGNCEFSGGSYADYPRYPNNNGCQSGYYNTGSHCCLPYTAECFGGGFLLDAIPGDPTGLDPVLPDLAPGGGGWGGCGCDPIERMDCFNAGGEWLESLCSCYSPILVDVLGDGFSMTDGRGGVWFDFAGDGTPRLMSWTSAGSDDAWLSLDRDGDGRVGGGRELFGTSTPQPAPAPGHQRNGFAALAVYDRPGNGGDGNGKIDGADAIFSSLRLWQDKNHNGVSEPAELHALPSLGAAAVHLDYKESKREDEHGNRFRYRAKVDDARGAKAGRWAWDVFPVKPR